MNLKTKIANWVLSHASFPNKCESGTELNWMLKDNCPCCINEPIESLSNYEYRKKYPAHNQIRMGVTTIYLCDVHLNELKNVINKE